MPAGIAGEVRAVLDLAFGERAGEAMKWLRIITRRRLPRCSGILQRAKGTQTSRGCIDIDAIAVAMRLAANLGVTLTRRRGFEYFGR
jgi:hypothetical protein